MPQQGYGPQPMFTGQQFGPQGQPWPQPQQPHWSGHPTPQYHPHQAMPQFVPQPSAQYTQPTATNPGTMYQPQPAPQPMPQQGYGPQPQGGQMPQQPQPQQQPTQGWSNPYQPVGGYGQPQYPGTGTWQQVPQQQYPQQTAQTHNPQAVPPALPPKQPRTGKMAVIFAPPHVHFMTTLTWAWISVVCAALGLLLFVASAAVTVVEIPNAIGLVINIVSFTKFDTLSFDDRRNMRTPKRVILAATLINCAGLFIGLMLYYISLGSR